LPGRKEPQLTLLKADNPLVVDFGQVYNQPRTEDEPTLMRIFFIANSRVGAEADMALAPMRWRL